MYITTDSASGNRHYAGLFFKFVKPTAGTGNMGTCNVFKPASCDGCTQVCDDLRSRGHHCQFFEDWSVHVFDPDYEKHHRKPADDSSSDLWIVVVAVGGVILIATALVLLIAAVTIAYHKRKLQQHRNSTTTANINPELEAFDVDYGL
jgi:hypothetical protein